MKRQLPSRLRKFNIFNTLQRRTLFHGELKLLNEKRLTLANLFVGKRELSSFQSTQIISCCRHSLQQVNTEHSYKTTIHRSLSTTSPNIEKPKEIKKEKVSILTLACKKRRGHKITMVTAYVSLSFSFLKNGKHFLSEKCSY